MFSSRAGKESEETKKAEELYTKLPPMSKHEYNGLTYEIGDLKKNKRGILTNQSQRVLTASKSNIQDN